MTADAWSTAEALARTHVLAEHAAVEPISFRRYHSMPFMLAVWWTGGGTHVLVHGGKVQTARGVAALPAWFESLGEGRLRTLDLEELCRVLAELGAFPDIPHYQGPWRHERHDDLNPTFRKRGVVLEYVTHFLHVFVPLPSDDPPAPFGGSRAPGTPDTFGRFTLQLFPVLPALEWKLEGTVDR